MAYHIPSHIPSASRTHIAASELRNFPIFSEHTKGNQGKPVRINVSLFKVFASVVDPKTAVGRKTVQQIENLRTVAGANQGRLSSINCAFKHTILANNIRVYYSILDDAEKGKQAVFITDIRPAHGESKGSAGLYVYDAFSGKHMKNPALDIQDKNIYVNGQVKDLEGAFKKAKTRINASDGQIAVFYSPPSVVNELGVWDRPNKTQATEGAIKELARVLQKGEKKRAYWIMEGEGASVMSHALDGVTSKLSGHRMRVLDPVDSTQTLIQKITLKGARMGGGDENVAPVTYSGDNRASQIMFASNAASLMSQLQRMRVMQGNRDANDSMIAGLGDAAIGDAFGKTTSALKTTAPRAGLPRKLVQNSPSPKQSSLTFISAIKRIL